MAEKRLWIEPGHAELSVREQCELLNLHRRNLYYEPVPESAENLHLMKLIDQLHLDRPAAGSRQLVDLLHRAGHEVNRKKVRRIMHMLGIQSLAPKPRTTIRQECHKVYPYLLRGLNIDRPNQVWCSDITYVPVQGGYLYLVAVMDWFSRHVLSWRLSNSMDVYFCKEALEEALSQGQPEIFNTDQGSQFTSRQYLEMLEQHEISISMDGKGRAIDNVMIERLWRTVKYEEIYLKDYLSGADCYNNLKEFFKFYSHERSHQSLQSKTPFEVYQHGL